MYNGEEMKKLIIFTMLLTSAYGYSMEISYENSMSKATPLATYHDVDALKSPTTLMKRLNDYWDTVIQNPDNPVPWANYLRLYDMSTPIGQRDFLPQQYKYQLTVFTALNDWFLNIRSARAIEHRIAKLTEMAKWLPTADPMYQKYWKALLTGLPTNNATQSLNAMENLDQLFANSLQTPQGSEEYLQLIDQANSILFNSSELATYWNVLRQQINSN